MVFRSLAFSFVALAFASLVACSGQSSPATSSFPIFSPTPAPSASPSPVLSPTPTPTPIQLAIGTTIGTTMGWPDGDTATGGQGQQVDSISCQAELLNAFHHHVHLSIFVNGAQVWLPKGLGMKNPGSGSTGFIYHAQCFYWLHTHDQTGIIHIEPPNATAFTLKNFFDIWGQPLSTTNVAGFSGNVAVYIDGVLQPGMDPTTVTFSPFEEITLVIGAPPAWIPNYAFPPNYP